MLRTNNFSFARKFPVNERLVANQKSFLPLQFSQYVFASSSNASPKKPIGVAHAKNTSLWKSGLILTALAGSILIRKFYHEVQENTAFSQRFDNEIEDKLNAKNSPMSKETALELERNLHEILDPIIQNAEETKSIRRIIASAICLQIIMNAHIDACDKAIARMELYQALAEGSAVNFGMLEQAIQGQTLSSQEMRGEVENLVDEFESTAVLAKNKKEGYQIDKKTLEEIRVSLVARIDREMQRIKNQK
jgi:hypothetical protein